MRVTIRVLGLRVWSSGFIALRHFAAQSFVVVGRAGHSGHETHEPLATLAHTTR